MPVFQEFRAESDNATGNRDFSESMVLLPDTGIGEIFVASEPRSNAAGPSSSGALYFFNRDGVGGPWSQFVKRTASDASGGSHFTHGLGGDGDVVAVGAHDSDAVVANGGRGYVLLQAEGGANNWGELTSVSLLPDAGTGTGWLFGRAVAVSGEYVLMGAPRYNSGAGANGALFLFKRSLGGPDNFDQVAVSPFFSTSPQGGAEYASAVAISGATIAVGENLRNSTNANNGRVYIIADTGSDTWADVTDFGPPNEVTDFFFGFRVALEGDMLAVCWFLSDFQGFVGIYERDADQWNLTKTLVAAVPAPDDNFGFSLAWNGPDSLFVGATEPSIGPGYVAHFRRNEGGADNWGQAGANIVASPAIPTGEQLGLWVASTPGFMAAGVPRANSVAGEAYLFTVPEAPGSPTGLVAIPGDAQIDLQWNANAEPNLQGYNVLRSLVSGSGFVQINGALVVGESFNDNTVSNDTTYLYVIEAVDDEPLSSAFSNEASATPATVNLPPVVTILTPTTGLTFEQGVSILFTGSSQDDLDGDISEALIWISDIQGPPLAGSPIGAEHRITGLVPGTHLITATSTDSGGLSAADSIVVTINPSESEEDQQIMARLARANDGVRSAGDYEVDERVQVAFGENVSIGSDNANYDSIASVVRAIDSLYPFRTTAAALFCSSDNPADAGIKYNFAATRGFSVLPPPLSFEEVLGEVELDGTTPVQLGTMDLQNLNNFSIQDGEAAPLGTIRIYAGPATAGVPDNLDLMLALILNTENLMSNCAISVPADRSFGLRSFGASAANKQITFRIAFRSPRSSDGQLGAFKLGPPAAASDGYTHVPFENPVAFNGPGTQVELRAQALSATADVSGVLSFRWLDERDA